MSFFFVSGHIYYKFLLMSLFLLVSGHIFLEILYMSHQLITPGLFLIFLRICPYFNSATKYVPLSQSGNAQASHHRGFPGAYLQR